ncbi:MAG: OB-fold domain-containing protein [Chloroflexota bacterium]|nr:OB-fold domain-containing protein [Chloroflexota bacterium]
MAEGEFTTNAFARHLAERRLMASCCQACRKLFVPCRAICPRCHATAMEWQEKSGRRRLVTFTAIADAPSTKEAEGYGRDNPYVVGIVELEEGRRVSARILGFDAKAPEKIAIGAPLTVQFIESEDGKKVTLAFGP